MIALDTLASSVVFGARRFERAVHDVGPWTLSIGGVTAPAERLKMPTGVTFVAKFPAMQRRSATAALACAGEVLAVFDSETTDRPFTLEWIMDVPEGVAA